ADPRERGNGQQSVVGIEDFDGNHYGTVVIGNQKWMTSNLRTSRYSNGDPILYLPIPSQWAADVSGAWSYYNGDAAYNDTYGKFYNWFAVTDPRNVCPTGWRVPTDADWKELEMQLGLTQTLAGTYGWRGNTANIGGQLKYVEVWQSPNAGATNSSGFMALPGGYKSVDGSFVGFGTEGFWWSATEHDPSLAWIRILSYQQEGTGRYQYLKQHGLYVRCVKN
ncbi:MAG: fibrobacter succinogenes major paralogous domain-containing protein, partial [Flavobacteriales bacterium]|nr:fibrobacter succinogenes major paralogous domain-containing protein [Flavobacteriales bacterium]